MAAMIVNDWLDCSLVAGLSADAKRESLKTIEGKRGAAGYKKLVDGQSESYPP